MILLLSIILLISLCSSGYFIYFYIKFKDKLDLIDNNKNSLDNLSKELSLIKKDIKILKNNPPEFTKRFSSIELRIKKTEDILSTFNSGFKVREGYY